MVAVQAGQVRWCAPEPADLAYLQASFVCTDPPKRIYIRGRGKSHPREWEFDAQAVIRGLRLPLAPPLFAVIGKVGTDIVAAAKFDLTPDPEIVTEARGWVFSACVAANYRGNRLGVILLDEAVQVMKEEARRLGKTQLRVTAKVHKNNLPSQVMLQSSNWSQTDLGSGDGSGLTREHYDVWSALAEF